MQESHSVPPIHGYEPSALAPALARACRHLLSHLTVAEGESGSYFRSPTRGRLLETALTLHLLKREGVEPYWQQRLRGWLRAHLHEGDTFTRLLTSEVLEQPVEQSAQQAIEAMLHNVEYAKDRKLRLLQVLLAEVGLYPLDSMPLRVGASMPSSWHRFSQIYAAGTRVMRARHRRLPVTALPESRWLRNYQSFNGGWEAQGLTTLVALLGLGRAYPDSLERGLRFLERSQRQDGSIPFCDITLFDTALAGLALLESPASTAPPELGVYLTARQSDDGAWAFNEGVMQTDVDCTTQALQLLIQLDGERFWPAIERGQQYLLRLQREDGGWPTYVPDGDSELTMTANAVLVLSLLLVRDPQLRRPIQRGLKLLMRRQQDNGTFERSWSKCETYSMFRVAWAVAMARAAGALTGEDEEEVVTEEALDRMLQRSAEYLHDHQHEDGSWGQSPDKPGDVLSTAYALAALCLMRRSERVERAVQFLLSRQTPKGDLPSEPDMVGPRPFTYDDPLLGTIFSVMALGMAARLPVQDPASRAIARARVSLAAVQ